jgi:hypothetical protein
MMRIDYATGEMYEDLDDKIFSFLGGALNPMNDMDALKDYDDSKYKASGPKEHLKTAGIMAKVPAYLLRSVFRGLAVGGILGGLIAITTGEDVSNYITEGAKTLGALEMGQYNFRLTYHSLIPKRRELIHSGKEIKQSRWVEKAQNSSKKKF